MRLFAALAVLAAAPAVTCANPTSTPEPSAPAPVAAPAPVEPVTAEPAAAPVAEFDHSHKVFDEILRATVKRDRLDYKKVDRKKLDAYIGQLRGVTKAQLESWSREQRYAFWINVYNAHVIEIVLDNYPLESIKDIGGKVFGQVWDKEFIKMNALHPKGDKDRLSLNDVEHEILRPRFKDARVHAAVNCASFSCPPLLAEAFVATKLEAQLDAQMKAFLVDTDRNRFDEKKGVVHASEIFKWFSEDFDRDAGSVREYMIEFAPADKKAFLKDAKIKYIDYDWSLNDVVAGS